MTPDERAAVVREYAEDHGWTCATDSLGDDTPGVYLYGRRGGFGFACAWSVNPDTGRTIALALDGQAGARFTITDGTREWRGPANAYRAALANPEWWTGQDD